MIEFGLLSRNQSVQLQQRFFFAFNIFNFLKPVMKRKLKFVLVLLRYGADYIGKNNWFYWDIDQYRVSMAKYQYFDIPQKSERP